MADFDQGLFGCFGDLNSCLITYFVPCFSAGKIAEHVDENCLMCGLLYCCVPWLAGWKLRGALRQKYDIPGSDMNDLILHCLCGGCATCQEYHEVLHRGGAVEALSMER